MYEDARIRIDVPLGTPLALIEYLAIEEAVKHCAGNRHSAARRLDITVPRVNRFLKLFRRSEETAPPKAAGVGTLSPGGEKTVTSDD
jgi:DNA-binding NtrC family response regulator